MIQNLVQIRKNFKKNLSFKTLLKMKVYNNFKKNT